MNMRQKRKEENRMKGFSAVASARPMDLLLSMPGVQEREMGRGEIY